MFTYPIFSNDGTLEDIIQSPEELDMAALERAFAATELGVNSKEDQNDFAQGFLEYVQEQHPGAALIVWHGHMLQED